MKNSKHLLFCYKSASSKAGPVQPSHAIAMYCAIESSNLGKLKEYEFLNIIAKNNKVIVYYNDLREGKLIARKKSLTTIKCI